MGLRIICFPSKTKIVVLSQNSTKDATKYLVSYEEEEYLYKS